jgi:hypothetical protein
MRLRLAWLPDEQRVPRVRLREFGRARRTQRGSAARSTSLKTLSVVKSNASSHQLRLHRLASLVERKVVLRRIDVDADGVALGELPFEDA